MTTLKRDPLPLAALRYHVTGAIERGERDPIVDPLPVLWLTGGRAAYVGYTTEPGEPGVIMTAHDYAGRALPGHGRTFENHEMGELFAIRRGYVKPFFRIDERIVSALPEGW